MSMSDELSTRLAEQLVSQKEALIKRGVANAVQGEPPGLLDLQGRLMCHTQNRTEYWSLDGELIAIIGPPRFVGTGNNMRAVISGEVVNEPEPESLPESGEVVHYRGPQ